MDQPQAFGHVDTIVHRGNVVAVGEEWSAPISGAAPVWRVWYRVLDLAQTSGDDQPGAWEDSTRWYELPWPPGVRPVGMSLLTMDLQIDHRYATVAGRWKTVSDGEHLYLFRALDLRDSDDGESIRTLLTWLG